MVSRVITWGAGVIAVLALDSHVPRLSRPVALGHTADVLTAPGLRWDATWYHEIATQGYVSRLHAVFFPLYPLAARVVGWVTGSVVVAGLLISCAAFLGALVALWRLTELELGPEAAGRTVWLLAMFPASLFFSAFYAEALFLALTVTSFLAARQRRWAWAGVLGMAASATRNSGWLLIVPLAVMYLQDRSPPRRPGRDALWLALVPLGAVAFGAYQWAHFGSPLTGSHAEKNWGREFVGPLSGAHAVLKDLWISVRDLVRGVNVTVDLHQLLLIGCFAVALVAFAGVARRLPTPYWLWCAICLIVMLSAPMPDYPLSATPRFLSVVFPLFMWAGTALERRSLYLLVLGVFGVGLAFLSGQFSTWHFIS